MCARIRARVQKRKSNRRRERDVKRDREIIHVCVCVWQRERERWRLCVGTAAGPAAREYGGALRRHPQHRLQQALRRDLDQVRLLYICVPCAGERPGIASTMTACGEETAGPVLGKGAEMPAGAAG